MEHQLVKAWRDEKLDKSPYRFEGDIDHLPEEKWVSMDYREFLNDENYALLEPSRFHLGLMPVPFVGDLAKADVFIALINPGYAVAVDYFVETDPEFTKLLRRNIKQDRLGDLAYPFFLLDPKWHWTAAGAWWHKLLGEVLRALSKQRGWTYVTTLRYAASRIAALELVPYHSGDSSHISSLQKDLKSSELIKKYMNEEVVRDAEADRALVIITTGRRHWNVQSSHANVVYPPENVRKARLSLSSEAGAKLFSRLARQV